MKYLKFFKKKKDINDIANRPTNYGSLIIDGYCSYSGGQIISPNSIQKFKIHGKGFENDMFDYLGWRDENPNSILLKGMGLFRESNLIVCPKVFLNDLIEICDKRDLDILLVSFYRSYGISEANIRVIEKGYNPLDDMPEDMYKYYIDHIVSEFAKKQKYYLNNYRFSEKKQILKSFYSTKRDRSYNDVINKNNGLIKFNTNIRMG